ncbi:hypothetical protein H072_8333 [Dactylellina haptotyla CBS 200.50]|uniref:Zn(2)-C6 fungal-type domain-containing protein n=1 Tax=Dactylellina haptotyla (strain CBS 200.50) TaxID=1284197 RepID=S8A553_DACHA|nr:hypothetical protein H072_8333 [Dactylellina haptotyla CBS 200.50]
MASTTTSYPPNPPPQHDPSAFHPINSFHGEPHREFPPRARVDSRADSWHESAPGPRNLTNGPAPSEHNLPPPIHARPPSHPPSRRPSLAIETASSTDIDKQPQSAQPYSGPEKQSPPHAPAATGPPPMQHRPTTVPPVVTAKREQNLQHLPPSQTAPPSPSAPLQYSHHPPLQPSQPTHPPPGAFTPLQPFPQAGPPPGPPPQMIAPGPPTAPPQTYHHHSAPPHMGGYAGGPPPNPRRLSVAPGIPESDEMSPMTGTFPYHMSTGTTYPPRRKAVRAAQACDACRTRKAKCDEGRPACTFCKDNNTPCVYREVPPPKQDRTMIMIQERVSNIESLIVKQQDDPTVVNLLKQILDAVSSRAEHDAAGENSAAPPPEDMGAQDQLPGSAVAGNQVSGLPGTASTGPISQVQTPVQATGNFAIPTATSAMAAPAEDTKEEDNFITIPHKHNTAAHKLLRWKTIRDLLDKRYPDNYVMDEEIRRGSLRIRGRGEGDPSLEIDMEEEEPYDELQNGAYYSPPAPGVVDYRSMKGFGGRLGRGPNEILRVDYETTEPLLEEFINNIYIMHPFLNREPLTEMVKRFSIRHGAGIAEALREEEPLVAGQSISPENSFASMATSGMMDRSQYPGLNQYPQHSYTAPPPTKAGSKRKRDSTVQPGPPPFTQGQPRNFYRQATPQNLPQQRIPATLESAMCLLVFALGAICSHKTPVPGPLPPHDPAPPMPYGLANQFPHGHQSLPPSYPPRDNLQNIDIIPGLAYCEKALNILSLHLGRSDVEYVQACLLAGLYWGQLGRPMDSWKWISSACMACQIMINQRLPAAGVNDVLRDTMVRTFWSCVQLESDLLAELDVPRSGITRLEGSETLQMNYGDKLSGSPEMWLYFMAQYHIRKILNQVHSELYKVSSTNSLKTANVLMEDLEDWRRTLPPFLQWSDNDPPANDINAARLRAKYYGAKYVINRPFVEHFIHNRTSNPSAALMNPGAMTSPAMSLSSLSQSSPPTSAHTPLGMDNRRGSSVTDDIREKFLEPCRTCLEAAVQSTSAFHGFDAERNRPILTSVFGTAHAQFGNMLVLQAAYKHPKLREFVNRGELQMLLDKTILFLRTLAPISPSLAQDVQILQDAASKLDFYHTT